MFRQLRKIVSTVILVAFISTTVRSPAYAQVDPMPFMPKPGVMVQLSPEYTPAYLKGIVIHPENALKFDFIIYKGDKELSDAQKREEYTKLTKYFLASLAIPDDDQWVNLSPYEKDRIIKDNFGKTEMGRDLLAQDYMLKQITASLIYPEDNLGRKFWDKVYTQAQKEYGTTNIPVNTFNKVWILPDNALIYEKGNTAYILKDHLRVLLEEDYLALKKHSGIQSQPGGMALAVSSSTLPNDPGSNVEASQGNNRTHAIASQIVREIVLPELQREVNEDANFAAVRQVYSGMLLATWYKQALKKSLLNAIYTNRSKVKGVDQDPKTNEMIYQQYLRAYKKGVFNFIQDDVDKYTNENIPRKYFSGGEGSFAMAADYFKRQVVNVVYAMTAPEVRDVQGDASKDVLVSVAAREPSEQQAWDAVTRMLNKKQQRRVETKSPPMLLITNSAAMMVKLQKTWDHKEIIPVDELLSKLAERRALPAVVKGGPESYDALVRLGWQNTLIEFLKQPFNPGDISKLRVALMGVDPNWESIDQSLNRFGIREGSDLYKAVFDLYHGPYVSRHRDIFIALSWLLEGIDFDSSPLEVVPDRKIINENQIPLQALVESKAQDIKDRAVGRDLRTVPGVGRDQFRIIWSGIWVQEVIYFNQSGQIDENANASTPGLEKTTIEVNGNGVLRATSLTHPNVANALELYNEEESTFLLPEQLRSLRNIINATPDDLFSKPLKQATISGLANVYLREALRVLVSAVRTHIENHFFLKSLPIVPGSVAELRIKELNDLTGELPSAAMNARDSVEEIITEIKALPWYARLSTDERSDLNGRLRTMGDPFVRAYYLIDEAKLYDGTAQQMSAFEKRLGELGKSPAMVSSIGYQIKMLEVMVKNLEERDSEGRLYRQLSGLLDEAKQLLIEKTPDKGHVAQIEDILGRTHDLMEVREQHDWLNTMPLTMFPYQLLEYEEQGGRVDISLNIPAARTGAYYTEIRGHVSRSDLDDFIKDCDVIDRTIKESGASVDEKSLELVLAAFDRQVKVFEAKIEPLPDENEAMMTPNKRNQTIMPPSRQNSIPLGGIDFNAANLNLKIKRDGKGVPLPLNQQDMASLSNLAGLEPVILEIRPAINLPFFSQLQAGPAPANT